MHTSTVNYVHLRARHNALPLDRGGYTVAYKRRKDGTYSVTICQCNTVQKYDEKLGEKIAKGRMERGQFFVQTKDALKNTLNLLHDKLSTGNLKVQLNLEDVQ